MLIEKMYIETENLVIKRFSEEDKEGLFELVSDKDTCSNDGTVDLVNFYLENKNIVLCD